MYYYIVNPAAGNGRINKIQYKLQALLKEKKIDGEFVKSTGKGDALKIAKGAVKKGFTTIVAVGGDGTVSEVTNGIADNPNIVLGIIPIGSTNVLANSLGISDWFTAVNTLAKRRVRTVSLGKVNDSFFITSLEIGFEPELLKERDNSFFLKRLILKKLFNFKPFRAKIKFDDKFSIDSEIFNISVFNTKTPRGSEEFFLNDGNLTSLLVPSMAKMSLLKNFFKIFKSSYEEMPYISKFKSKKIFIDTGKVPQKIFADAEYIGVTPVEIMVSPKKIKVIVSKDRKFN